MAEPPSEMEKVDVSAELERSSGPSEMEKIRNKRLAKLQNQTAASQKESSTASEGRSTASTTSDPVNMNSTMTREAQEAPKPKTNVSGNTAQNSLSPTAPNPFSQLGINLENNAAPKINISRAQAGSGNPGLESISRSQTSKGFPASENTIETWEDKALSNIFRVSLSEDIRKDTHAHILHYLPSVRAELEEQGAPVRMSTAVLEQAILEAASNLPPVKKSPLLNPSPALEYLLGCWKRVVRQIRGVGKLADAAKTEILKEAKRLCMSYCMFAVTMPDMFGEDAPSINPLTAHLLVDPDDDRGICYDFITEAVRRFGEDETVKEALVGAIEDLSRQLSKMTMVDNYKPYIHALGNLTRFPQIINALTQSPMFLPSKIRAQDIEQKTLLGPFFRISPLQGAVTTTYFNSPKTKDKAVVVNAQRALKMSSQTLQTELQDIVNQIIRSSKESREKMLNWFALTVNLNHKRRALQVDKKTVSSDGFMYNVTVCLDQLCEPFIDAVFSKVGRVDIDYLRRDPRVDIKDETKLNADQKASDAFYSGKATGSTNFISEVFFLTVAAHHYGSETIAAALDTLEKDIKHIEKQLAQIEGDRTKWLGTPSWPLYEKALKEITTQRDKAMSYQMALQGVLFDDQGQGRSMGFLRFVTVWLLRLLSPNHDYPAKGISLPLPTVESDIIACLPEYFLENITKNYLFIFRHMPQIVGSTQIEEIVTLCITLLQTSNYIKNPYLKSSLVTILFTGIWPSTTRTRGILGDVLNSMGFALEHLLHALMKFYIEVENTGTHTQFFDKFNIRYEIFQVIKCIWPNAVYRQRLAQESKLNVDFFIRFVNLLLNDVTFVLDESLSGFKKIHDLSQELQNNDLEESSREEKEALLAQTKKSAKSYMQLANETVAMLKLFTEALADAFTMPEIVQRLADMLDYNLEALAGPKSNNLKVIDPESYHFNPKALLSDIVDVYLNLKAKKSFIEAVARDGRSYKPDTFKGATWILKRFSLRAPDEIRAWEGLMDEFKKAYEEDLQLEEDLGDIPEEFQDPLLYSLMADPVILPTSKISIDRSTIRSHLLSDPNDPFNRSPLKIEDVIDNVELREQIMAFKAQKKAEKVAAAADVMDTSAG